MRLAIVSAALAWAAQFSGTAAADLYRWVDPESGSVKFSSYPPPWYGDAAQERRAPKVEHIPARRDAPARRDEPARDQDGAQARPPGAGQQIALALEALNERRKALLAAFESLQRPEDFSRAGAGLRQQYEAYQAVTVEMDRLDPKGAERRNAVNQPVLERIAQGLRAQFNPTAPVQER
jgi:hypothetical protein